MGEKQEDLAPRIELIFDDERDLVAWARPQAQFLQQRRFDGLDLGHLIEEVEAIGTVYRDQPQVAMQGLLAYWLKLTYATGRRPHEAFWRRGAASRQRYIEESLVRYPSLKSDLDGLYSRVYPRALRAASTLNLMRRNWVHSPLTRQKRSNCLMLENGLHAVAGLVGILTTPILDKTMNGRRHLVRSL
jgi:hypothetical protein